MTIASYEFGAPTRPPIRHDNGHLDQFAPRAPTVKDHIQYRYWQGKLEAAEAGQNVPFMPHNDIPDALAAYRHFLDGSGTKRTINYERYVTNDPSGRITLMNVIAEARSAAHELHLRRRMLQKFQFTGTALYANSGNVHFPYPATENWQKAIGAHSFWLSGDVAISETKAQTSYDLTFILHVEDMYNFNPGAADIATGIPDEANGVFEITGQAKQYLNVAELSRRVRWTGSPAGSYKIAQQPTGRQRQPGDNRRVRNRL